jgi:hypothetical protein
LTAQEIPKKNNERRNRISDEKDKNCMRGKKFTNFVQIVRFHVMSALALALGSTFDLINELRASPTDLVS